MNSPAPVMNYCVFLPSGKAQFDFRALKDFGYTSSQVEQGLIAATKSGAVSTRPIYGIDPARGTEMCRPEPMQGSLL